MALKIVIKTTDANATRRCYVISIALKEAMVSEIGNRV
jgi:hypothetical protein